MERKIGEIFEYNGEWYQCVKSDNTCNGCVGKFQPYSFCNGFKECVGKIFKKLEKVEEPYEHCGKLYQCYKLPMEIEIRLLPNNCNPIGIDNLVEIEIKEDMEEKKLNLKPFSLEAAKAGKPVCTRDGRKARIVCFDMNSFNNHIIVALITEENGTESISSYTSEGKWKETETENDLMMLPEKKEGWVNLYKSSAYSTKEEAMKYRNKCNDYIDTIKIEWEE